MADRRELYADEQTTLLAALEGWQSALWTALPVRVLTPLDPVRRTVSLQCLVRVKLQKPDHTFEWVEFPPFINCPVVFPSGGGVTLTFPVRAGDEGLALFASRCIDGWWQNGGIQNQPELRMHDLSDGFYLPGVSSVPDVIPGISTTRAQLRDDPGTTYIEVDPVGPAINVTTPGSITAHADGNLTATIGGTTNITSQGAATWNVPSGLQINGNVSIAGTVIATGEGTFNGGHTVSQHTHTQGNDTNGDTEKPTDPPQG